MMNRRELLSRSAYGLGAAALWSLLERDVRATPAHLQFVPRAKRVIFVFMSGGPSHLDLHDPKPLLEKMHGQPVSRFIAGDTG